MNKLFYKMIRFILKCFFNILYRPTVIGRENIPSKGPFVLAGNHTSYLDPIMLICTVPLEIHFLAKDQLFKGIKGFFIRLMGCIPVNRKIHDKSALNMACLTLQENKVIGIFPEGTINRKDRGLLPFKIGAVKMSHDCCCFLIPFVIKGEYKLFRKSVIISFLPGKIMGDDLSLENDNLREEINLVLEEFDERN